MKIVSITSKNTLRKFSGSQYFSGLVSGKEEHDMEKIMERTKGMNRNDAPSENKNKDRGIEK
jgi:hypothetical protein